MIVPAMGMRQIRCQLTAVRCQQEGCSSTVQADLTRRKLEREGSPKTKKANVEDGDSVTIFRMLKVPTEHLRRDCNPREQGHQGNYFTDSPKLATACS